MPGKPQGKAKRTHLSKKSRARQRGETAPPAQIKVETPQSTAATPAPAARPAAPPSRAKVIQYPYITGEIKRISILAGIIIVILIVLSLVLS